jgi:antitoxin ParD1/3/4
MSKNTSVLLGDYFKTFIRQEVESGKYSSASEVIRTALRLLETQEKKIDELREALVLGEKSGMVENFNPAEHLSNMRKKYVSD